jgi:hypothetical protein
MRHQHVKLLLDRPDRENGPAAADLQGGAAFDLDTFAPRIAGNAFGSAHRLVAIEILLPARISMAAPGKST